MNKKRQAVVCGKKFLKNLKGYSLVYLANGADKLDNDKYYNKRLYHVQHDEHSGRMSVSKRCLSKKPHIDKMYIYEGCKMKGYYARKRFEDTWKWYGKDGNWYSSSELAENDGLERHLYKPGEKLKASLDCESPTFLVAQWENEKTGEQVQRGSHIFSHQIMAHALGVYEGQVYGNTREGLLSSYDKGIRYFEADVALTEDGKMVLSHGWNEQSCQTTGMAYRPEFDHMTYDLFMSQRIKGQQVMDIYDLRKFMEEHEDTFFEIDFHRTNLEDKVKALLEAFSDYPALINRLLVQAESRKLCRELQSLYHFPNVQLILGKEWAFKLEQGINFAYQHNVDTIAMNYQVFDKKIVQTLRIAGFNVMAYTLYNDVDKAKELLDMGVNTLCTDMITPQDLLK